MQLKLWIHLKNNIYMYIYISIHMHIFICKMIPLLYDHPAISPSLHLNQSVNEMSLYLEKVCNLKTPKLSKLVRIVLLGDTLSL